MTMLVPSAWRNGKDISPEVARVLRIPPLLQQPWDGPAALCFTDGITVGACLIATACPARYKLTDGGIFCIGSEVGTIEPDDAHVVEKAASRRAK